MYRVCVGRSLEGKLRIGLAEQSVLQALAVAVTLTPPGDHTAPKLSPEALKVNLLLLFITPRRCISKMALFNPQSTQLEVAPDLNWRYFPPSRLNLKSHPIYTGASFPPREVTLVSIMALFSPQARIDENALTIKTVYCECPNYEAVIAALLQHGVTSLAEHCGLTCGVPLKPMLAHPTKRIDEIFTRYLHMTRRGRDVTGRVEYVYNKFQIFYFIHILSAIVTAGADETCLAIISLFL